MATRALNPAAKLAGSDESEFLLRALIAQERENRSMIKSLKDRLEHEVARGDQMLAEAGLSPAR